MNIFLISNLFPSSKRPNFGTFVGEFAKGIEKCGGTISHKAVITWRPNNPLIKLFLYFSLYSKIIYWGLFGKYDVIYVHYIAHTSLPVYLVSLFRKKKIILNVHGDDILPRTFFVKFLQHLIKLLLSKSDLVVVPSYFFKKVFLSKFNYDKDKVFISPSGGIDKSIFHKINDCRQKLNIQNDDFIIGYISRIDIGKGWDTFVDAMIEVHKYRPNIKAIIIGHGDQVNDLKQQIYNLDYITFIEGLKRKELPTYYSAFNVFVFPTRLQESLGLVGLEAMACGTPVIGSNIGALPTFIHHDKNGFLFQPGDSEDLANCILKFIQMPIANQIILSKDAKETAESYEFSR